MYKRIILLMLCFFMICVTIVCDADFEQYTASAQQMQTSIFHDGNRMSDEEFFGKWDAQANKWEVEGKIDYTYASELQYVEDYVKDGDYTNAKEAILHYYRNRPLKHSLTTARSPATARAMAEGVFYSEAAPFEIFSVSSTPQWYSFDVTEKVSVGSTVDFTLHALYRDFCEEDEEQIAIFDSLESGKNAAYLDIQQGGNRVKLPVTEDMYIRAGRYTAVRYGHDKEVMVSEGWPVDGAPPAKGVAPAGNGTRQAHFKFNCATLDPSEPIVSATLYLYGYATENDMELLIAKPNDAAWEEENASWQNFAVRILSYNGFEDGYDWSKLSGAHNEFYNVNVRLWNLPTLFAETYATGNEYYAQKGIEMYLDFIEDHGGLMYDDDSGGKRLNAAFRGDSASVRLVFDALNTESLDEVAFTSMLKFMWQEPEAMSGPLMEGQLNINGMAFAIDSLLRYTVYFPEFKRRDVWVDNAMQRIRDFPKEGLFDDGCYMESTGGYDLGVLDSMSNFYDITLGSDITIPEEFETYYHKFALAEMGLSRPDRGQYQWGDNGGGDDIVSYLKRPAEYTQDPELLYFVSDGIEGTQPSYTSIFFPEGKLGVMRTSWEPDAVAAFIIGRVGGSHSHKHMNHFNLFAYGRQLLIDTGTSSYDPKSPSYSWERFRTESHNTIEVNDMGQNSSAADELFGASDVEMYCNDQFDYYRGISHAYDDVTHTRDVAFAKGQKFFVVTDYVTANHGTQTINKYNQTWHMPVTANPVMDDQTKVVKTQFVSGANLMVIPVNPVGYTAAQLEKNVTENRHISYVQTVAGDAVFQTVLFPFEGAIEEVAVSPIPVDDGNTSTAAAFSIELPDGSNAISFSNLDAGQSRGFGWYDTDAASLYMEYDGRNDTMQLLSANQVCNIKENGNDIVESSKTLSDISISYAGSVMHIETSEQLDLEHEYIAIAAPEGIDLVLYNQEILPFYQVDGKIVIGQYSLELLAKPEASGVKSATLPAMEIQYPIADGDEEIIVKIEIQEHTKIMASMDWNGIFSVPLLKGHAGFQDYKSYGLIPFAEYTLDRPFKITLDGRTDLRAAIGGETPQCQLSTDSFAAAEDMLESGRIAYIETAEYTAVYAMHLADCTIYSDDSTHIGDKKPETLYPISGGHIRPSGGNSSGGGDIAGPPQSMEQQPNTPSGNQPENQQESSIVFSDIENHWAKDDILYMAEHGYVEGDGVAFYPDAEISRAEITAIICRILDLPEQSVIEGHFADVLSNAWYANAIEAAAEAGIISGDGERFYPEQAVTRAQICKIIVNAYNVNHYNNIQHYDTQQVPTDEYVFSDASDFEAWAKPYIAKAYALGFIKGRPDGSFGASETTTRAEAAVMLKRFLTKDGNC